MHTQLLATISPRIFSLAAATCTNFNRTHPIAYAHLDLVHSYLSIRENDMSKDASENLDLFFQLICQSTVLSNLKISKEMLMIAPVVSTIQRLSRPQLEVNSSSLHNAMRGLLIFHELNLRTSGDLAKTIERGLNLSAEDFYRAAFTLFALFHDRPLNQLGLLLLDPTFYNEELESKYGITYDTLIIAARRLSTNKEGTSEWHRATLTHNALLRKNVPLPFFDTPLYQVAHNELPFIQGRTPKHQLFICPSPLLLFSSLSSILIRLASQSETLKEGHELNVKLGEAMEDYLVKHALPNIFPDSNIVKISSGPEVSADFLVENENFRIIIECKKSLNAALARSLATAKDVVPTWERIKRAIDQCGGAMRRIPKSSKVTIAFVLCEETVLNDASYFLTILDRIGYLKEISVEYIEVMSIADFEILFYHKHASDIVSHIKSNWDSYRESGQIAKFSPVIKSEIKDKSIFTKTHLHDAFEALFPGIDYEKAGSP